MAFPSKTARVFLIAGQSNAVGQNPSAGLTGLNTELTTPYSGIEYAERIVTNTDATVLSEFGLGPLIERPLDTHVGVELTLGRLLASHRCPDWSPCDEVILLKFAAGAANVNAFRFFHPSGINAEYKDFLATRIADLSGRFSAVTYHDLFWIQGEADRSPGFATQYPANYAALESELTALGYSFNTVFAQLKEDVTTTNNAGVPQGPLAAEINQGMIAAGYDVTVNNDDLATSDGIHYTPDAYQELARRLFAASVAG